MSHPNVTFDSRHNNFDLIRLLAAMQVALGHSISHLDINIYIPLLQYFPGVPIFFFVSGFLISLSYERSASFSIYSKNRFLRIYPALWVCLILSLVSVVLAGYEIPINLGLLKWLVAQLTWGQFYNPQFLRDYGVGVLNGSLWTIPVEISFYLIFPLICFLGNRLGNSSCPLAIQFLWKW